MLATRRSAMRRWEPILPVLNEFQKQFCHPAMPPLHLLVGSDKAWPAKDYEIRKPNGFPHLLRGVYLLFDQTERLQYVGAAVSDFNSRVWGHDQHFERRCIDVVPLMPPWHVLTLSLEFYLIQRLDPPQNTTYRGYGIECAGAHQPIPSAPKLPNG
jgi:hypothetical protein